jgi:gamma-glutamylputrescine oxidase
MISESIWLKNPATPLPGLDRETTCEVVVVGGGITGVAAALFLAEKGVRTVVVDSGPIAGGASGRNGGFLLAGTVDDFAVAVERYGEARAAWIWRFSADNLALIGELAGRLLEEGIDCGYRPTGSLRLADSELEMKTIRESRELLAGHGFRLSLLGRDELPPATPLSYVGGALSPTDGEFNPAAFVRGIGQLAVKSGATLYERSEITRLTESPEGVMAGAARGSVRAKQALVALNAYSGRLLPTLAKLIRPVRGQALSTEPLDKRLFEQPCYSHYGYHWWRQLPRGQLIAGGWRERAMETEDVGDETPANPVQGFIEEFVRRVDRHATVERRWAGLMGFTADGLPLAGRVPGSERIWVAGGYNGHGNGFAVRLARDLVEAMLGSPGGGLAVFDPARASLQPQTAS